MQKGNIAEFTFRPRNMREQIGIGAVTILIAETLGLAVTGVQPSLPGIKPVEFVVGFRRNNK